MADITTFDEFFDRQPDLIRFCDGLVHALTRRFKDDGLNFDSVTGRVKTRKSIKGKLEKINDDGSLKYPLGIQELNDLVALRVTVYTVEDIERISRSLCATFKETERDYKYDALLKRRTFGYSGFHHLFQIGQNSGIPGLAEFPDLTFEVQIRTVVQHAWAEFEHDNRYKRPDGHELTSSEDRAFDRAAALVETLDGIFSDLASSRTSASVATAIESSAIEGAPEASVTVTGGVQVAAISREEWEAANREFEFATVDLDSLNTQDRMARAGRMVRWGLSKVLPEVGSSKLDQYEFLAQCATAVGITDLGVLLSEITQQNVSSLMGQMPYKIEPGHVRLVDDLLLSRFGSRYVEATFSIGDDSNRKGKLQWRLGKLLEGGGVPEA